MRSRSLWLVRTHVLSHFPVRARALPIFLACSFGLAIMPVGSDLRAAYPLFGSKSWIRAKLGPFEAISDDGRTPAIQALSQFEQFRYALGAAMGQPDLRLDPPLRILVFRDAREMAAQGCDGIS